MILDKIHRIVLFCLVWAVFFTVLPASPAFSIQENNQISKIENLKQINDKTISDIAKQNLIINLQNHINRRHKNATKIDKQLMELETGFNAFPEKATINLTLKNIGVASILRIIAKEGGMNIVIDESVMGSITAELKNISLNQAMQIILTSEELEARVSDNTIFVASRPAMAKKGLNRRYIRTFKLNNANAVYVAGILRASIFNKGYKVKDSVQGAALQAVPASSGTQAGGIQNNETGTSTGQSKLIDSQTIKGKVERLEPGENFGDAGKLASKIKIQHYTAETGDITIDNNDGGAIVVPDTRTNSLLVAGLKNDIILAGEAIKYLDKPLKQVSIEVSLIELTKDDTKNLGLDITTQGGKMSGGFNAVSGEFPGYNFSSLANQSGITLNTLGRINDEISLKLNNLLKNEQAKLLANPKIVALDGSESLIKITDQVVSKVKTTVTDTSVTYDAELADVGIVLNILPKIGDDGNITMRIRPSITSALPQQLIGESKDGAAIKITPISTREVILQDVRVHSGETLAIAGLTKEKDTKTVGKIPILGYIPVLGKLFSNTDYEHEKNELIILITPTIIDDVAYNNDDNL